MRAGSRHITAWCLSALWVVASLGSTLPAVAQETEVPSRATVTTGGAVPVVECMWALPDMDYDASNGMQYVDGSGFHDDDPVTDPDPVFPCAGVPPQYESGVRHTVQLSANPDDAPTARLVELWGAFSHPDGLAELEAVSWRVFYPDGASSTTVDGTALPRDDCESLGAEAGGTGLDPGSMFDAANGTHQVHLQSIIDWGPAIVARCLQRQARLFSGTLEISYLDPCGEYRVEAAAVSKDGDVTHSELFFDVFCVTAIHLDFTSVSYGTVQPNGRQTLDGDLDFALPAVPAGNAPGANKPTLRNAGSGGANLGIIFAPMLQMDSGGSPVPFGARIDRFGAAFGLSASRLQWIDPIPAGSSTWFDAAPDRTLCAGELGMMALVIRPGTIPGGFTYRGEVTVLVRGDQSGTPALPAGYTCANDRGVWLGPGPGNQR